MLNGMFPRNLRRVVGWAKSCFIQRGVRGGVRSHPCFVRTWDRDTLRRVSVAVLSKYSGEASRDAVVLVQLQSGVGFSCHLFPQLRDHTCFATHTLSLLEEGSGRSWACTPFSSCSY